MPIPKWARGPFELLRHAEEHYRSGQDMDRRIAMVNFDNSIEASIATFIHTQAKDSDGKKLDAAKREELTKNFHTHLEFLYVHLASKGIALDHQKEDLRHYHRCRNQQYHGMTLTVPDMEDLTGIRAAAMWVFNALFEESDCESEIKAKIEIAAQPEKRPRNDIFDQLIDSVYEPIDVAEMMFQVSDVLYAVDDEAYAAIAMQIRDGTNEPEDEELVGAPLDE